MTRRIITTAVIAAARPRRCTALAGRAQERQAVSLTGCLRTGSTSTVYLLRGAPARRAD